jgi:hypothetical protein
MKVDLKRRLEKSIEAAWIKRADVGSFTVADVVADLVADNSDLWKQHREGILTEWLTPKVHRAVHRSIGLPDTQLRLPGFDVPKLIVAGNTLVRIETATLQQLRKFEEWYKNRIASYKYGRRSKDQVKQDRKVLRELRRLDRTVSRYAGGDDNMTIIACLEAHEQPGGKTSEARKEVARNAIKARWDARTKNQ